MALRQRALAQGARLLLSSAIRGRRGVVSSATTAAAPEAAAAALTTSATDGRIYAACVLERLPILKSPAPTWEVEHQAWRQERKLASGQLKRYPQLGDARQREGGDSASAASGGGGAGGAGAASSSSFPFQTPADGAGDARTMKRRLRVKLVLLVKSKEGGGGGQGGWHFPAAERRDGETIRATAERALRQAIGYPPLFFIGNAPMGHLEEGGGADGGGGGGGSSSGETRRAGAGAEGGEGGASATKKTFFHLAQVLNDPWEVELAREGGAVDYAWVAEDELDKYLGGRGGAAAAATAGSSGGGGGGGGSTTPLLDLTRRML